MSDGHIARQAVSLCMLRSCFFRFFFCSFFLTGKMKTSKATSYLFCFVSYSLPRLFKCFVPSLFVAVAGTRDNTWTLLVGGNNGNEKYYIQVITNINVSIRYHELRIKWLTKSCTSILIQCSHCIEWKYKNFAMTI